MGWACLLAVACAPTLTSLRPADAPLWQDPDRHLFRGPPAEYYSGHLTNRFDLIFVRPVAQAFAVDPAGEALNTNRLDEVPDSSWFTNRIGRHPMTPEQVATGPCTTPPLDASKAWTVTSSKPNGASPGFVIVGSDGNRYVLKFDRLSQGPRATAADAIVSRLYYAVGYTTPCNRVVFFERSQLRVAEDAEEEDWLGNKRPFDERALDESLEKAPRTRDGRYRALASLWLPGKPLGPWRFEGTRNDDPNDIVSHEDRRELRAMRLVAAWTAHMDQREQNTLSMWVEVRPGWGWISHDLLDFGDCLGFVAEPPALGRRMAGHAYSLDIGQMVSSWFTFGLVDRPFENERFGPTGPIFGYFNVEHFDPEAWVPSIPNPAFGRMSEHDGAWMARILAHFDRAQLMRVIRTGRLGTRRLRDELLRILVGRRNRILRRYLMRFSPLTEPAVTRHGESSALCVRDLAAFSGITQIGKTSYSARLKLDGQPWIQGTIRRHGDRVCARLPARTTEAARMVVEFSSRTAAYPNLGPLRVRLLREGVRTRVTAIERPR